MGEDDFSGYHVTMGGGQYWREDKFMTSCNCWQLVDPTFHPAAASSANLS
jgi:hypothetical protein